MKSMLNLAKHKSLKLTLLLATSFTSGSILSMQLETKRKAAVEEALSDLPERKTQAAETQMTQNLKDLSGVRFDKLRTKGGEVRDPLMPEEFSNDICALITDYSHPTHTEHEAYTQRKLFGNITTWAIKEYPQVALYYANGEQIIYDFQTQKTIADKTTKHVQSAAIVIKGFNPFVKTSRTLSVYQSDMTMTALINKITITEPEYIRSYTELPGNLIALSVSHGDTTYKLVLWNYVTNKITAVYPMNSRIENIFTLSHDRLALITTHGDCIIQDLSTNKTFELTSEKSPSALMSVSKISELENGTICTICHGTLKLWDAKNYTCLTTIFDCHYIIPLHQKIAVCFYDQTMAILDLATFKLSPITTLNENINQSYNKVNDSTIIITRTDRYKRFYSFYTTQADTPYAHIEQYLNLNPHENRLCDVDVEFIGKHLYKIMPTYFQLDITWYDHDAVTLLRKLTLEAKANLKQLLTNLRERQTKLQDAGSQEAITLEGEEVCWFKALPERIQINIKSHFNVAPIVDIG